MHDLREEMQAMKSRLINDGPQKTYVLVLEKDDEAVGCIEGFAWEHGLAAAQLTGVGAFSDAVLGFFDWETKEYRKIPVKEQVEVVSFIGDVALGPDGTPALHPHVVVSRSDGMAMGGHLLEAHVRPTLEVVLTESPRHLHKRKDPESGLALIVPEG
jgi:predicted DNA-binding protein with PD1-like motif